MKPKRIQSVDFLRGFTILAMIVVNTPGDWAAVYPILLHASWDGLTLADLVFPFFLILVGIAIAIAYQKQQKSLALYKKIGLRAFKLILLGLFLNAFTPIYPFIKPLETLRYPGVLQRIGVVFLITSLLYIHLNKKALLGIGVVLLITYWIFMTMIPLPNGMLPVLERNPANWANYLDVFLFKNHTYQSDYDPEGFISTFPSIVTAIIGIYLGELLLSTSKSKIIQMAISGVLLLILGYVWNIYFPINKALWSSSFVLVTGGYGILAFGVCYYFADYKAYSFGGLIKMVGANAIAIYVISMLLSTISNTLTLSSGISINDWIFQTLFVYPFLSYTFSSFLFAISIAICYIGCAFVLYKKQIFIKV